MDGFDLSRKALMRAIEDRGIKESEIDGMMTTGSFAVLHPMYSVLFSEYVGIRSRYNSLMQIGGATHIPNIMTAANAIDGEMCEVAVITSAEPLRSLSGFQRLFQLFSGDVTALFAAGGTQAIRGPLRAQDDVQHC